VSDLRERVAQAIRDSAETSRKRNFFLDCADAAIALVRAEVLEEAARVAEMLNGTVRPGNIVEALYIPPTAKDAAAAIRALKTS